MVTTYKRLPQTSLQAVCRQWTVVRWEDWYGEFRFDWNPIVRSFHLEKYTMKQRLLGVDGWTAVFSLSKTSGTFIFEFANWNLWHFPSLCAKWVCSIINFKRFLSDRFELCNVGTCVEKCYRKTLSYMTKNDIGYICEKCGEYKILNYNIQFVLLLSCIILYYGKQKSTVKIKSFYPYF